jgi:hypothetical protein
MIGDRNLTTTTTPTGAETFEMKDDHNIRLIVSSKWWTTATNLLLATAVTATADLIPTRLPLVRKPAK